MFNMKLQVVPKNNQINKRKNKHNNHLLMILIKINKK